MDSLDIEDQVRVLRICVMFFESENNWVNLVTSLSTLVKIALMVESCA